MTDLVPAWVASLNPVWLLVAIALGTLIRLLWKDLQGRRDMREKAIAERARWRGEVDSDRTSFKESLADLKVSVDRILRRLMRVTGDDMNTVVARSRLALTPLGKTISEKIRAKAWAEELRPALADETEGMAPYEVQEFCMNLARGPRLETTPERRGLVLGLAFDHGLHEADVLEVIAIELRDALLALREPTDT